MTLPFLIYRKMKFDIYESVNALTSNAIEGKYSEFGEILEELLNNREEIPLSSHEILKWATFQTLTNISINQFFNVNVTISRGDREETLHAIDICEVAQKEIIKAYARKVVSVFDAARNNRYTAKILRGAIERLNEYKAER